MDNNRQSNNPKPIKGRPQKKDELKDAYRINEKITAKEVRLVGDNVEQGVYSIYDAKIIITDYTAITAALNKNYTIVTLLLQSKKAVRKTTAAQPLK